MSLSIRQGYEGLAESYKYKAFISYSHSDEKWATWLHKSLEAYKPPKAIVGKETAMGTIPARLAPVFRDRDELPSATNLGELLTESLRWSATQIVICSPAAAKSRWVDEEILTFKRLGRSKRIFCLIVDGEPWASDIPGQEDQECFPPALRYEIGDDAELSDIRAEPIAADARVEGDGKANARLKLISGVLGVGFDALKQREQHRRQQRMLVITTAAFVGMAITSGLAVTAYLARIEAEEQRNRAQIEAETARQTTQFMVGLFEVSDPSEALGNTITAREILDKGAARIDDELVDQPEIHATLMDTMGSVYTSLGLYTQATTLLQKALAMRRSLHGEEDLEVARTYDRLGDVLTLQAEYGQAGEYMRNALAVRSALLGERDPEVADSLAGLAEVFTKEGSFEEAEPLLRQALDIRIASLGEENLEVAESTERLGLNLFDQGNLDAAEPFLRRAIDVRRKLAGDKPHPDLARRVVW
jgi:tetratricopeptide (TPR) repeat protein